MEGEGRATPTRELLAEALSSAESLRVEINQLKSRLNAQTLLLPACAGGEELLGASYVGPHMLGLLPLGSASPERSHTHLALPVVVVKGSQLQEVLESNGAVGAKTERQQPLAEPPSEQSSLARQISLGRQASSGGRPSGEQQVPPKSVDSELLDSEQPWKIAAVSQPGARLQRQGGYASTNKRTTDAAVGTSPAVQQLAEALLPGSSSSDMSTVAAALQPEQQQQQQQECVEAPGQGQGAPPHEPSSGAREPAASPGAGPAGSRSRQQSTYASIHKSTARGRQRIGTHLPEQLQELEQWSESQALRRLLQNLEQANAVKQATDARKKLHTPRERKDLVTSRDSGVETKSGAAKPSRDQQRPRARQPRERTQPFVPHPAAAPSMAPAPTPPASARRSSKESHFSLAGLVAAELAPASEPTLAAEEPPQPLSPRVASGGYAGSPSAARTALAAKAAGGVIAAPPRAWSPRPVSPRAASGQPPSPRSASPPRPPVQPSLRIPGPKFPPQCLLPQSPRSPRRTKNEPAQRRQQEQEATAGQQGERGPSQDGDVQASGWSDTSEVPLRVFYSRRSSIATVGGPSPGPEGSGQAQGPQPAALHHSSSSALDVGPLEAGLTGARAAAQQDAPLADSMLGWGWQPPLQQQQQQHGPQGQPQVWAPPQPTPGHEQQQEKLTPRVQEQAAAKQQRGSFMRLLVEKLSPFHSHRLQSPPATPAGTAAAKGHGHMPAVQSQQQSRRCLSIFPALGQLTEPPPAPGLESPCKAISGAGTDSANHTCTVAVTASSGQAFGTPRVADSQEQQQQQQQAVREAPQQPQVGMKRAPPSAIEAPNSLKKRTPPPSRGPSHGSEVAEVWGPPQPFPSMEQGPSQQRASAVGIAYALPAALGSSSPGFSLVQLGSKSAADSAQESQAGAGASALEGQAGAAAGAAKQEQQASPGQPSSTIASHAEQDSFAAAKQEGWAVSGQQLATDQPYALVRVTVGPQKASGRAAGVAEGQPAAKSPARAVERPQLQPKRPQQEKAPVKLRRHAFVGRGRSPPVNLVQPVCAIQRSPVKRPESAGPTASLASRRGPATATSAVAAPPAAAQPCSSSSAGGLDEGNAAGESEVLHSTSSFGPPLRMHLVSRAAGEAAEGQDGQQQQQPGSIPSSPRRPHSVQSTRSYAERLHPEQLHSSQAGRGCGEPHFMLPTQSSISKKWSSPPDVIPAPSLSPVAWKPPSAVVPPLGSPPCSPQAVPHQPSVHTAGYAQRALDRGTSQRERSPGAPSSNEAHSAAGVGRQLEQSAMGAEALGQAGPDGSAMPSPSRELPSESTWQEMSLPAELTGQQQGPSLEAQTVTVLIGGIHAVHRQRQLERAGGSGVVRGPTSAEAEVGSQAWGGPGGATSGASARVTAAGRQQQQEEAAVRGVHRRSTSMAVAPAPEGVSLREHALGRMLLEESPAFGSMPVDHLLRVLKEGRMVRKSWVKPDFKMGGSTRLMQCAVGVGGKVLLQYPHGLFRKPLQCVIKRVIIPSAASWQQGQYLVVDTDRGMLRIEPSSKAYYTLWVLGLNAALNLAAQRGTGGLARTSSLPGTAGGLGRVHSVPGAAGGLGRVSSMPGMAGGSRAGSTSIILLAADQPWNSNFLIG